MNNFLLENIQKHISLSEKEEQLLLHSFKEKNINKKDFLLREGEVNKAVVFVIDGILRSYSVDKNGFEHVIQFAPNGWWMVDMFSFVNQKPAKLFIDALENTQLLWLPKIELDNLYQSVPKLERFFRILAENAVITYQDRLINNLSLPASERYKNFCSQYPTLIQCLPQKQVASYIGVTPEFLSKMLANLKSV